MCIICIDIVRERLTFEEAWRNFTEMWENLDEDHTWEVFHKIRELQKEENREK